MVDKMKFNIAIDGPSASGKSTIAEVLATKYGLTHIDTGAMYRCVALYAKEHDLDVNDETAMVGAVEQSKIEFGPEKTIWLNQIDVTNLIRTEEISWLASVLSKHALVRAKLVEAQQTLAADKGFILDGRDIGTVVLPEAEIKIFLTASAAARSERRYLEYLLKGEQVAYDTILAEIVKRDKQDSSRANSPLRQAADAIALDTSGLSISQVLKEIELIIATKLGD